VCMCELLPPTWNAQSLAIKPKPVVVCVARVALTMTEKVEQGICIYTLPETWALMLTNL
jgi:hypothetical protein